MPISSTLPTIPMARITRSTVISSVFPLLNRSCDDIGPFRAPSPVPRCGSAAALLECFLRERRYVLVLDGQDRSITSTTVTSTSVAVKLAIRSNCPGADNQDRLRHGFRDHSILVGPDEFPSGSSPGRGTWHRSQGQYAGLRVLPPFSRPSQQKLLRTGGTARELFQPSKTVTLFFFRRCPTPAFNWAAILRGARPFQVDGGVLDKMP